MAARVANPHAIVTTDWVDEHKDDENVTLVEVDVDTEAYDQGHVPGAIGWNWTTQLNDELRRDILDRRQMAALLGESGIGRNTTVVLYGDNNNWFAAYAYWQIKMFGHQRLMIMDGGRVKWIAGGPRHDHRSAPARTPDLQGPPGADSSLRATRDYVLDVASGDNNVGLVDVRRRPSTVASCWPRRTFPRRARSAAATSPVRLTSRGPRRSTKRTAPSSPSTNSARSTAVKASPAKRRSSPTAASASVPPTPGSCSPRFSATQRSATTTALGPSTAP